MAELNHVVNGRFDDKVVLLTGVASGIGRCTALRLAAEGASVFGVDIDEDGLAETKAGVEGAGGKMAIQRTDVRSVDECRTAVADCFAQFGRLDVLGNIAGVAWQAHVADVTEDAWDTMNAINVKGPFFLSQAAIPHLLESEGNIVNIASNAGLMGCAYTVPYCASKGGIVNMTRALAMEFIKKPIRVNAIAPGGVNTPLVSNFEMADDMDFSIIANLMGFRPASEPEQIAALFAFVASDEAANIHGSIISADGGLTAA